jgi:hypothetical protein
MDGGECHPGGVRVSYTRSDHGRDVGVVNLVRVVRLLVGGYSERP